MTAPFLVGKKTILRPLSLADVPLLTKWVNDPETRRNLTVRFPVSEIAEKEWLEKKSVLAPLPTEVTLAIDTKDGNLIGTMGLNSINWMDGNAITGTVIGEKGNRGKGYATDAKMTLLRWVFEELRLHRIRSMALARNAASIAYSQKCGYAVEGTFKEHLFREGKHIDVVTLACFYPSWKRAAKKLGYL